MKPSLLVLQASSLCNLDCTYCYVPNRQDRSVMSEATLRAALTMGLSRHAEGDLVRVLWHAGEPLTAGLDFFERASDIIRQTTPPGVRVAQALQTNGTLIDKAWCRFFLREKLLVGLSLDGPANIHDRYRRTRGDRPTHPLVERGVEHLRQHGIPLHALSVLTPLSLKFPDQIFDYFIDAGFSSLSFNLEETEGIHTSGVDRQFREAYRTFMARIFERWHAAKQRPYIRELASMSSAISAFLQDQNFIRCLDDQIPLRNLIVTREGEISTFSPELASGTASNPLHFSLGSVHKVRSLDELSALPKLAEMEREIKSGTARCRSECDYFPIWGGHRLQQVLRERHLRLRRNRALRHTSAGSRRCCR